MAEIARLRDADGDEWVPEDGGWRCVDPDHHTWLPTREAVDYIWGPLTEVKE